MKKVRAYVKGFEKGKIFGYIITILSSKNITVYISVDKKTADKKIRANANSEEIKAAQRIITEAVSHGGEKVTIYYFLDSTETGTVLPVSPDDKLKVSFVKVSGCIKDNYAEFMNEFSETVNDEICQKIILNGGKFKIEKSMFTEINPTMAKRFIYGLDDMKFAYRRRVL